MAESSPTAIGFEATFLISAGLATILGVARLRHAGQHREDTAVAPTPFGGQEWRALVSDGRLFAVTVLAAVPGKLILAGFLFYLVPLYLSELGSRQSVIGWMIMLYGVSTLVCMPFAARFADRSGRHTAVVAAGGVLAGLGCLASLSETMVGGPSNAVMIAILALGFGHALSLTSQIAIVQEVASHHGGLGPSVDHRRLPAGGAGRHGARAARGRRVRRKLRIPGRDRRHRG